MRAGEAAKRSAPSKLKGLLSQARDWIVDFDLPEFRLPHSAYVFPHEVCITPLKMDGQVISRSARICIGIELTVPMEDNVEKWHQAKRDKYEDEIRLEAEKNSYKFYSIVIEVGARGWIPNNVLSSLNLLGLQSAREVCHRLSLVAVKSFYILWINRWNRDFNPLGSTLASKVVQRCQI